MGRQASAQSSPSLPGLSAGQQTPWHVGTLPNGNTLETMDVKQDYPTLARQGQIRAGEGYLSETNMHTHNDFGCCPFLSHSEEIHRAAIEDVISWRMPATDACEGDALPFP